MEPDLHDVYIVREIGLYSAYQYQKGIPVLLYRTKHIALCYDLEEMIFYHLGPVDVTLKWSTGKRLQLQEAGCQLQSQHVQVVFLPTDTEPSLLTELLDKGTAFLRYFLGRTRQI